MRNYDYAKIKKRRRRLRLSQVTLAKAAGLSREHLIEIEKGRSVPKATMLAKIANVLQVKESYFFVDSVH